MHSVTHEQVIVQIATRCTFGFAETESSTANLLAFLPVEILESLLSRLTPTSSPVNDYFATQAQKVLMHCSVWQPPSVEQLQNV
jgi:hypothetical protein